RTEAQHTRRGRSCDEEECQSAAAFARGCGARRNNSEMNTSPSNTPEPAGVSLSTEALAKADDPGYSSSSKPFYWSVRRELWENRSIYVAPLIVAMVVLFGFLVSTIGMPERRQAVLLLDPAHQRAAIGAPYDVAAMMLIFTAFIVGVFYCLDALHGERRDRSLLF